MRPKEIVSMWLCVDRRAEPTSIGREFLESLIEKTIAAAVAEETERCAKVAEGFVHTRSDCEAGTTGFEVAELIRTRNTDGGKG